MGGSAPADVRAARLSEARSLLGRATRSWSAQSPARAWSGQPRAPSPPGGSLLGERVLPVAPALEPLLPGGGLRRGGVVAVRSSTSVALLLALLAEASTQGSWCALVGMPELGLVAAGEAGLVLSRVALVPRPGTDLVAVTAALLDGVELVAVAGVERLRAGDRQRLVARARQRGAVLLALGRWPGADLEVGGEAGRWQGLAGDGAGRLRCRRVRVRVGGRGAAHRGRSASVLLPDPTGALSSTRWSEEAARDASGSRKAG